MQDNTLWKKRLTLSLVALLVLPMTILGTPVSRLAVRNLKAAPVKPKLAPDLEELLAQDDEEQRQARLGKTLAQVRQERIARAAKRVSSATEDDAQRTSINGALLPSTEVLAEEKQSFIVQVDGTTPTVLWREKVAQLGGTIRQTYGQSGLLTIDAPRTAIRQLAAEGSISYISPDRLVAASGHIANTTGWRNTGIWDAGDTNTSTWLVGGYGHIAVIDSGMDSNHNLLRWSTSGGTTKVKYSKDFTGQNITSDPYGHGTHVASMLAGDSGLSSSAYRGVADGSNLLNLRVLDSSGAGAASNVIAALDWCVTNKAAWNIHQ